MDKCELIETFKLYRHSHPNLSQCWIAYLGLKKRHYDDFVIKQTREVLELLEKGYLDFTQSDIVRLLLYKRSV
jgi:hypothetical protein